MNVMLVMLALPLVYSAVPVCGIPLCRVREFEAQVQQLLADEMLTPEEAREISLNFTDLQDTLRSRWEGADLYVYGSLLNGLGAKTSDVDIYVQIPDYNASADVYLVEETAKLLYKQPEKYNNFDVKTYLWVPMITFYDIEKQRYIDLSFRNYGGVINTRLVSYYLKLDRRHYLLAATVKLWCKVHKLTGKRYAPNYAIYVMVLFYLQQKNMIPSGFKVQAHLPPRVTNGWNHNFEEIPFKVENDESLYELLGGFFKYYSEFNFKRDCASLYAGRPIAKSDFTDPSKIPEEFTMFKQNFDPFDNKTVKLQRDMCAQDIFEHNVNTLRRVKPKDVIRFKDQLKSAAKMYDELSCDQFLKSILVNDEINKTQSLGKKFEVHVEF